MIRIGAVNPDTSHPVAFAEHLRERGGAAYACVYNDGFRADDEIEALIARYGLEGRCAALEELAERCNIAFLHGCDWDRHLEHAAPILEAGKPVFIDKPIVGKAADCARLEALAAQGKVILGSSSMRYAEEVVAFAERPEEERGAILHAHGTIGTDEFNYAIHVVEALGGLLGPGLVSAEFVGRAERGGAPCETYYLRHASGASATYAVSHGIWQPCDLTVMTTRTTTSFRIDTSKLYAALLERILEAVETGQSRMAPAPDLAESVRAMLAGRLSREGGGGEVALEDVPLDDPGFDGAEFARGYARAAKHVRCYWGEPA